MAVGDWVLTVESIREFDDVAERPVIRRPDDFACLVGEFLRGAQVVELVVDLCVFAFTLIGARGLRVPVS